MGWRQTLDVDHNRMIMKLGPHIQRYTAEGLLWSEVAPAVKTVDATSQLYETVAPIRVYRKWFNGIDVALNGAVYANDVLWTLGSAPATHVQFGNEEHQRFDQGFEDYVRCTREFCQRIYERRPDLRVIAYNFSWGNPQIGEMQYLQSQNWGRPPGIFNLDLGMNEYWGPNGFRIWDALRHRSVHDWSGANHPDIYIMECGRDAVETDKRGWIDQGLTPEQYAQELIDYNSELQRDPYVKAAFVFTVGNYPPFETYESKDLIHLLRPYYQNTETGGGTTMDQTERWLRDMWARQGVRNPGGAFWNYALNIARTEGRVIIPQAVNPPTDGSVPENYDQPGVVVAYTIPALHWTQATGVVEGLPFA